MEELNALEELISQTMGIDKNKEIFNLWYEVLFLRNMLNHIIKNNPDIASCINQFAIEDSRAQAQIEIGVKFANCNITFTDPETTKGDQP